MAGYDPDRFVNISENEKSELTCSICHEILNNPLVANCCLQTFCKDCITDWLRNHNNCPYDRKHLNVNSLREPPRILTNLLGKLEIRCDYREKGCPDILTLENLAQHKTTCAFNIQTCDTCGCVLRRGHNCVKELLALKEKLNEENEILRAEKESLNQNIKENDEKYTQEIHSLKFQKSILDHLNGKYNQEIQKLKAENDELVSNLTEIKNKSKHEMNGLRTESETLMTSKDKFNKTWDKNRAYGSVIRPNAMLFENKSSIRDLINDSRKYLNNPLITECTTSSLMSDKIVDIVCRELATNENMFYICQNVVYKCDHEFGSSWYCLAGYDKSSQNYCQCSCYIKIKFGNIRFKIFRSKFLDLPVIRRRLRNGKLKREIKVFESDMSSVMVSNVEKISFNALERFDTLKEIVADIQTQMESRYPGLWQCFAYNYGESCVHSEKKQSISYEIAEMKLNLFVCDSNQCLNQITSQQTEPKLSFSSVTSNPE